MKSGTLGSERSAVGASPRLACGDPAPHETSTPPMVQRVPVQVEPNDATRTEFVQVIVGWLVRQGFTSSAQLLREEATAQLRDEHNQRKSLRAMCRCIDEQDWEGTQKNLRKLQLRVPSARSSGSFQTEDAAPLAALTRTLPFLLAQQQFLELVDEDDSQRAFAFFMRSIKPFEASISREHFKKLNYVLTCKSVAECASLYPEYHGWTPDLGRSQLLQHIHRVVGDCLTEPYCRQGNITRLGGVDGNAEGDATTLKSLETMVAQSIAYEMLLNEFPTLGRVRQTVTVRSILTPLEAQLPPTEPLLQLDVSHIVAELGLSAHGPWVERGALNPHSSVGDMSGGTGASGPVTAKRMETRAKDAVRLSACQPFLSVPAIAAGTHDGRVFWIPLSDPAALATASSAASRGGAAPVAAAGSTGSRRTPAVAPANVTSTGGGGGGARDAACLLYSLKYAVRGMQRHQTKLLIWGGPQAVVLDVSTRDATLTGVSAASQYPSQGAKVGGVRGAIAAMEEADGNSEVTHIFTHAADVVSSCFFPCGTIVATGLSDGTVTVWDTLSGTKMFENTFSTNPVVAVLANSTGSTYYAGTKDGTICAVDVVTGMLLTTMAAPVAGELASLSLSPSSTLLLASYRGGALRLWDVLLGTQLPYHFLGAEKTAKSSYPVVFGAQDDQVIAGSSDGCLYMWMLTGPTATGPVVTPFDAQQLANASSAGVPGGTNVGLMQRWTQGSLVRPIAQLPLHRTSVSDVKMDGTFLVSCAADGIVYVCSSGLKSQ